MKKLIYKILTAISIMLGECQCPCHELGYNSCSLCMNKHNMKIKNDGVKLGKSSKGIYNPTFISNFRYLGTFLTHLFSPIILLMAWDTKRYPIVKFSKIFSSFISPLKITLIFTTKFTKQWPTLSPINPTMQSIIPNFITLPLAMFFAKSSSIMARYRTKFTSASFNSARMLKKFFLTNQTISFNKVYLIPRYLTFNKYHA